VFVNLYFSKNVFHLCTFVSVFYETPSLQNRFFLIKEKYTYVCARMCSIFRFKSYFNSFSKFLNNIVRFLIQKKNIRACVFVEIEKYKFFFFLPSYVLKTWCLFPCILNMAILIKKGNSFFLHSFSFRFCKVRDKMCACVRKLYVVVIVVVVSTTTSTIVPKRPDRT